MLRQHFTNQQLAELSEGIDPHESPDLDYYPLASPGERFPVYDPDMPPRLEPRPGCTLSNKIGIYGAVHVLSYTDTLSQPGSMVHL